MGNKHYYSVNELYCSNKQKTYSGDASAAAFLLGGIGTGNVSVGARGELRSWQIFNEPGQFNFLPYTFFALRAEVEGGEAVSKILESKLNPPFTHPEGTLRCELGGLPRFEKSTMSAEYPFVRVKLEDKQVPVQVEMEAFTPFIPLNADDSGIPGAYLNYRVKNPTNQPVTVSIAGSLANAVGFEKYDIWNHMKLNGNPVNEYQERNGLKGLFFRGENVPEKHIANGTMCLATSEDDVTAKPLWFQGEWTDGAQDFWDDFISDGSLDIDSGKVQEGCAIAKIYDFSYLHFSDSIGSICIKKVLKPGEERVFPFLLTWNFPNRVRDWGDTDKHVKAVQEYHYEIVGTYYSTLFQDAWTVADYMNQKKEILEGDSRKFSQAFFSSTLPGYVLEAVADNITILRSPTCFRTENGDFFGWEGVENTVGCGAGTCTHVWNYAQTVAFLFPELEQSMRRIEFLQEIQADGYMPFRTYRPFGLPAWEMLPSADGQLGAVVRLYREWRLSGDNRLIEDCWDGVVRSMEYAIRTWDTDGDFVPDSAQHVTYDTELYGMTSMVSTLFFAALIAAAEMAEYMGDQERARRYRDGAEKGAKLMDEKCWNGEYYIQLIDDVDKYRYQYGKGCLSDQLLGQFLAQEAGLGYVLPKNHVKKAAESIFRYNFIERASDFGHVQRAYIFNDEMGLTPCTWPLGERPRFPFIYFGEVWTGIEYEVAALLIREDLLEEGLTIVKAVRDRQDGYRRNPWSENESGYYYTRAMASYSILNALSGFSCDQRKNQMSFQPKLNQDNFRCFWCNGKSWGIFSQKKEKGEIRQELQVLYGEKDVSVIN